MTCPKCGSVVFVGASFCGHCGATLTPSRFPSPPAAAASAARRPFKRPLGVTLLAVLDLFGGLLGLGASALWLAAAQSPDLTRVEGAVALQALAAVGVLFSLIYLVAGVGLLRLTPWGRIAQMILAGIGLLAVPLGTIVSAVILYYFTRPGVKVLFSGRAPNEVTADEYQAVERDAAKGTIVVVAVAGVVVLGVVFIGIIAALAIPSLLRARMLGNEAAAIGRIRSMMSAQAAYSVSNNNQYGTPECLAAPAQCLADYPPNAPAFLSRELASDPVRSGYQFRFDGGDRSDGIEAGSAVARSFPAWVYTAEPTTPGTTGVRSFCGDSTGRICAYGDGRTPRPDAGRCPADCEDLR